MYMTMTLAGTMSCSSRTRSFGPDLRDDSNRVVPAGLGLGIECVSHQVRQDLDQEPLRGDPWVQ